MDRIDWRADGENYAQIASRQAPDDPVVQALLAIYCELRHANDDEGASSDAVQAALAAVSGKPRAQ